MDFYCFSPCGTTEASARAIARGMGEDCNLIDLSSPDVVEREAGDLVAVAFPVYGGHVPPLVLERLDEVWPSASAGEGKKAIALAAYGNRSYENGLEEIDGYLTGKGFECIAFATAIGQHPLCGKIAAGRPDADDIAVLEGFGEKIAAKASEGGRASGYASVDEVKPYTFGPSPVTDDECIACGICADSCPIQVIEVNDAAASPETCLGCGRCIQVCPVDARHFPAEAAAMFEGFLTKVASERREPELFL